MTVNLASLVIRPKQAAQRRLIQGLPGIQTVFVPTKTKSKMNKKTKGKQDEQQRKFEH